MINPKKILISRTDNIGDVVLTLPLAKVLKDNFPEASIVFLGKTYTAPIISRCMNVDEFVDFNRLDAHFVNDLEIDAIIHVFPRKELALKAKKENVKYRIGTSHRLYHLLTCNKIVSFTRKNSNLHESQLNLKLLEPLGITNEYSLDELKNMFGLKTDKKISTNKNYTLIHPNKFKLIIHPKSKGSAKEWGIENYQKLIKLLPQDKFEIFITGTADEAHYLDKLTVLTQPNLKNLCGTLTLNELIDFIGFCDGLLAASTGPLHIAAALGLHTLGLFSPQRPIHPGRWAPLGANANFMVYDPGCPRCSTGKKCNCIQHIEVEKVADYFLNKLP